jgi:hypothetical protein
MGFKILVIGVLVLIVASLGKALFHLSRPEAEDGGKMLNALSWRIGLSVLLFLLLLLAYHQGWVHPGN